MLHRLLSSGAIGLVTDALLASPVAAQDQTVNVFAGGFVPRGLAARGADDVLVRDFYLNSGGFLVFDQKDFTGPTAGVEYLAGLGDFFDAGFSVGIYSRTAPAIDADFTRPNGGDVRADLKLRIVPMTATFRYLPLGHHDAIEPYIGAGVAILNWRYTEAGDFVTSGQRIINDTFTGSDTTVGPVILGGLRVPAGALRIGGEVRYQGGRGILPADQDFAGPRINLGGFNYLFTVGVRF